MLSSALVHPCYFPSIAQFSVLVTRPCIWEVSDNYQKQTLRNRTYVYGPNGKQLLSVPVKHTKSEQGHQLFSQVKIENNFNWQKQHWKTLQTAYRTSPYFEFYEDELYPLFDNSYEHLVKLNMDTIQAVLSCLQLDVHFEKTSFYQEKPLEKDCRFLTEAKKKQPFEFPSYYQIFSEKFGFLANLSILDLLFHQGPDTTAYLNQLSIKI